MNRPAPRFSWRFAFVSLAMATLTASLVAEASVRVAFPEWAPRTARLTSFWQYDPNYGWHHTPGASGRFSSVGFDVEVRINSHGFRGREISYVRESGVRRIVALGDSHVWGFGVEEEEAFCRQLERLIPDLEVVNLGVSGYSTDQELLLYAREGFRYAADVVMLVVSHNDLRANTRTIESSIYGKPRFLVTGEGLVLDNHPVPRPSPIRRTAFELSGRSYLLTRMLRVLEPFLRLEEAARIASAREAEDREGRRGARSPFPWTEAERITADLIVEMQKTVARKQPEAEFLVVFADFRSDLGVEAAAYFRGRGIRSVALDGYVDPAWHLPDGLHWTPEGHAAVAERLADDLRPLLPEQLPR